MKVIAAILALAAAASAMTLNHERIFGDWKRQFGRTYATSGEFGRVQQLNLNIPSGASLLPEPSLAVSAGLVGVHELSSH